MIIYRWADTIGPLADEIVLRPTDPESVGVLRKPAIAAELALLRSKLAPARQVDIGLVGDFEFSQARSVSYAEAAMLSIANVVDGIFFQQVGLRVNVAYLRLYDSADPFSSADVPTLLEEIVTLKFDTPELRAAGLVHLITGRDLDEGSDAPANARLLGGAVFGALCDARFAVGVTQWTGGSATTVAAHEIAHNLGAPHDAEPGSPCESTSDQYLMSPFFNFSQTFSECSVQQMMLELATADCLVNLPPNDIAVSWLSGPTVAVLDRPFNVAFAVNFSGAVDALDVQIRFSGRGIRFEHYSYQSIPCTRTGDEINCTATKFGRNGGSAWFGASVVPVESGPVSIEVSASAANDYNAANNVYVFTVNVPPAPSFSLSSATATRTVIKPGEVTDLAWDVINKGPIAATNVRAELDFNAFNALELVGAQMPGGGACTRDPMNVYKWLCPIGTIASGQSFRPTINVRGVGPSDMAPRTTTGGFVSLKLIAAEPAANQNESWRSPDVTITPNIADLSVTPTGPSSVSTGSKVTWVLTARNAGPDRVEQVSVGFSAYPGIAFDSVTAGVGSCTISELMSPMFGNCQLGALAPGDSREVRIELTAPTPRDYGSKQGISA